jgi:hypothetical protein
VTADPYTDLMRDLADLTATVEHQRAEAQTWYADQRAAAERALTSAEDAVEDANRAEKAARELVNRIDDESAEVWHTMEIRLGGRPGRFGMLPPPTDSHTGNPDAVLDDIRAALDRARTPRAMPRSAYPMLVLIGILSTGVAFAVRQALRIAGREYGGELAVGLPVIGLVIALLGPVAAIWPTKLLADRRRATLDTPSVAVVVGAGVLTVAALLTAYR